MKKIIALILAGVLALSFAGCSAKDDSVETTTAPSNEGTTSAAVEDTTADNTLYSTSAAAYKSAGKSSGKSFETILDTNEYAMYYNIFYNQQGSDFDNKAVFKKGIFATLYDEYNHVVRYYVWGYNDQTKCCDWQWELKIDDTSNLPSNGSTIEVTGTFKSNEGALDGYWIEEPKITVKKEFKGPSCDVDMSTMSATLERVEAYYIMNKAQELEGKTVEMYGRVMSDTAIQHPYYDGAFEIPVETKDKMPAIGIMVLVSGTISDGKIINAKVSITEDY